MEDTFVDRVVIGGDFLDFDFISSHNAGQLRKIENGRFEDQYKNGHNLLNQIQNAATEKNPDCAFTWLEGNHEYRVERYLDVNPEMEGIVEVPIYLDLKARNVEWIPCWSKGKFLKLGKLIFHHGLYTIDGHAKKMAQSFGKSILYGHVHSIDSYSLVYQGDNSTIVGQSCGCLCKYSLDYMRGKPSKWQQGFAVVHMKPNGFYGYSVVRIFGGGFISPEGKVYD